MYDHTKNKLSEAYGVELDRVNKAKEAMTELVKNRVIQAAKENDRSQKVSVLVEKIEGEMQDLTDTEIALIIMVLIKDVLESEAMSVLKGIVEGVPDEWIKAVVEHDCDNCEAYSECKLKIKKARNEN